MNNMLCRVLSVVGANMDGDRQCTAKLLESKFDVIFFTGGAMSLVARSFKRKAIVALQAAHQWAR